MVETLLLLVVFIVVGAIVLWLAAYIVDHLPMIPSWGKSVILALIGLILLVVFLQVFLPRLNISLG
jgi:hypothetical protein